MSLAKRIAEFAAEKKAEDVTILDMRKAANFCDFFVICTGTSSRQVQAVADGVEDGLNKLGMPSRHKQGYRQGRWVLLDLGTVVLHVFDKDSRGFYGLEYLWQEAHRVEWP